MPAPAAPVRHGLARPEAVRRRDVVRTLVGVSALNELQYRVNFFLQLFQSLVALATAIAVVALVFLYTPSLGGWSPWELMVVVGVHTALGGVIRSVIQPSMQLLMEDIREGKLDFALTKPVDAQMLVSLRRITVWPLVDVVVGAGVVVVAATRIEGVTILGIALAVAAVLLGAVMIYCLWLVITTGAFWIVRMEHVAELFNGLYQAGRWPIGLFPGWLRGLFTVLVPLAFAVTLPSEALTGRAGLLALGGAVVFTAVLVAFTRWFWRLGVKSYAGASA
ncbi:ABC transporter permease [Egicoccus sp. AB-alg6-2]|uniref:ABC transporter permease n=1 Tax=Egicoccus sp. AB-alg6-2 TaxID=3242692 RepID=UPI00359DE9BC